MMTPQAQAEAWVLGKLLLLQQHLEVLPTREAQAAFLRRGLCEVPGVADVRLCLLGLWLPACPSSLPVCGLAAPPDSSTPRFYTPQCCAAGGTDSLSLPLRTAGKLYGFLVLMVAEAAALAPYRPYLANTAHSFANLLEKEAMSAELHQEIARRQQADRHKDEFLALLGHELRNPLAPIRNAVQILKRTAPADPALQKLQAMLDRQVSHLSRLVDDLLDVSRIVQGKLMVHKTSVDLAGVLEQALDASRPLIQAHRHELSVVWPEHCLRLAGDEVRLTQIVSNLLTNAAKYTPEGGRIWLSVVREDGHALLRVRDTGIGLAPAMRSRIFELFTQAERSLDRSQGGLGVGLTLAKRLVELHGGRIEAHSDGPGQGSEFRVWLPLLEAADAPPHDSARAV